MNTEVASAFVRIRPNMHGFKGETEGGVREAFSGVAKIVAGAFAIEEGFKLGKEMVQGAAEVQKSQEVIQAQFGKSAEYVKAFGEEAGKAFGLSAVHADATSAKFGIMFHNLGIGKESAANMTVGFEKLAGSLSAIRGADPSLILDKLTLAAAGNTRGLKALGIVIDGNAIKHEALRLHMTRTIKDGITPAIKAQAIYSLATKNLDDFQKQAEEHSGDLINVQRRLSAEWSNAKDRLGAGLLPVMSQLVGFLADRLPQGIDLVSRGFGLIGDQARQLAGFLAPVFDPLVAEVQSLRDLFGEGGIGAVFDRLKQQFLDLSPAAKALVVAVGAIAVAFVAMSAPVTSLFVLGEALVQLYQRSQTFHDIVDKAFTDVKIVVGAVSVFISEQWRLHGDKIVADARAAFGALRSVVVNVVAFVQALWARFGSTIIANARATWTMIYAVVKSQIEFVRDTIKFVLDVIHGRWGAAWGDLKGAVHAVFTGIVAILRGQVTILGNTAKGIGSAILHAMMTPINAIKNGFVSLFNWLERQAINAALKIVEPFSHLKFGGGWARTMKTQLHTELANMDADAANAGTKVGDSLGRNLAGGFFPWASSIGNSLSSIVNTVNNVIGQINAATISGVAGQVANFITSTISRFSAPAAPEVPTPAFTPTGAGPAAAAPAGAGAAGGSKTTQAGRDKLVKIALSMLGKPYLWGGSGPNAFDCSGLVMWAFSQIGVSLPHYTGSQVGQGKHVNIANIQPGDTVYTNYGERAHGTGGPGVPGHVGIYVGGGMVEQAPHTGDVVKRTPLSQFIAGGRYEIRDFFPPGTPASERLKKPPPPPILPQQLLDQISRFGTEASTRDNTGIAAKGFLMREQRMLRLAETTLQKELKGTTGKRHDQIAKAITDVQNQLDKVGVLIRDAVIIVGDALLPTALKTKLAGLKSTFQAQSAISSVKIGDAAQLYQDALLANSEQQGEVLVAEVNVLKVKLARAAGKQKTAIKAELSKVQANLKAINDQVLQELKATVQAAQSKLSGLFNTVKAKMDAEFEAATAAIITKLGVQFFQGVLTPAEQALKDFQDKAKDNNLVDAYNAAQNALYDAITHGGDVAAARDALQAARDAITQDKLQTDATASRTAADKAYADAVKKVTDERTALEAKMNDALDKLLENIENGTGSLSDLDAIAAQYGVDISEVAIPEMKDLVDATASLAAAFRALEAQVKKITGKSGNIGGDPTVIRGKSDDSFKTPAWSDPGFWIPGLASGGLVKATPGGTVVRVGEGIDDEVVMPVRKLAATIGGAKSIVAALSPLSMLEAINRTNREMLAELRQQTLHLATPATAVPMLNANASAIRARR